MDMNLLSEGDTSLGNQDLQATQYQFPYHYIPQLEPKMFLSRHWQFAASYIAALELVAARLLPLAQSEGPAYRHLDIGCGDGALLYRLSHLAGFGAARFSGVDTDARSIDWARMFNPGVYLHAGDMADIPETYSSASLIEVLEHIAPDLLPEFMANAARLLRPGGLMVITVPSVEKPVARKHFQHFSFSSIRLLLTTHFDVVEIRGFERKDVVVRLVDSLRANRIFRMDAPRLNRIAVNRLRRLHMAQSGCGRLFITCVRRQGGPA